MDNVIGIKISELRAKQGLTQEELAIKLGYSKQTVSNWETGLKIPRMGAIQKIADFFNVKKSDIIEDSVEIKGNSKRNLTIQEAIDTAMTYGGKPLTEKDKAVIKRITEAYLDGNL